MQDDDNNNIVFCPKQAGDKKNAGNGEKSRIPGGA
jgi:hypothetical protein